MSVRKNMTSLLLSQALMWSVSFVLVIQAPNALGGDSWGDLSYAIAFVGFFTLVAGFGTNTLLVREIARDHTLMRPLVYNALGLKLVMVIVLPIVGFGLALLLGNRGTVLLLVVIGFLGMAAQAFNEIPAGALAGVEVMGPPAFFQVVQVYVANILGIVLLALGYGVVIYALVLSLSSYIPLVLSVPILRREVRKFPQTPERRAQFDRRTWRLLIRGGIPLMTLTVINMIYGTVDIPILGHLTDYATVGWYTLAQRWIGIPIFIATAVVTAYFPQFSAHGHPMTEEFPRLVNKAVRIVMLVAVPCAIGLAMIADDLIGRLYNSTYRSSISPMRILAFQVPLTAMDTVLATALIASNRMRSYVYVAAAAAVFNPLACLVLIRWSANRYGNGAIGAAIVTVATELLIMTGALLLRDRRVLDGRSTSLCVRTVLAGLLIVPTLLVATSWPLVVRIALGGVVYGAGLIVFRGVTVTEVRATVASVALRRRAVPQPID